MSTQILVVDDESVTRRLVTHALKAIHITVIGAENGSDALVQAEAGTFALAIIDINLPDISGFDVIRQLKQLSHMQAVPMIMFTARNQRNDEIAAQEVGAAGILYKPFSTQELRDLVRHHLGLEPG